MLTAITEWFQSCLNLESISFESCTSIGNFAFCDCSKLSSINLPKLTYLNVRVFANTALTKIELNGVTDSTNSEVRSILNNKYYTGCHFQGCKQLTSVTMKSLTHIGSNMFDGCDLINEVFLDSCKTMDNGCFNSCNSIKKVTLGYDSVTFGNIPNPKVITNACFPNALSVPENIFLDHIELISCKLPIVSIIGESAFSGCTRLVELEIPNVIEFKGDSIFYNCESLETLLIRSLVTVNPESSNIFKGCRQLKSISLPDLPPKVFHPDTFLGLDCQVYIPPNSITIYDNDVSVTGDEANDNKWCGIDLKEHTYINVICDENKGMGTNFLDACISSGILTSEIENLEIVDGPLTQDEMKVINDIFVNLKQLKIDNSVSIENDMIPMNFIKNHEKIESVYIYSSLRSIEESAFEGCSRLSSFTCKNARELKSRCFFGPTSLEILTFELVDTLTGSNFFSNNPILRTIELPKLSTASVNGFISENSPLLKSISLPETPPTFITGTFLLDINPLVIGISNEAAINYDASDGVDNDMKFYSLQLTYTLIICNIDGEAKSGISLKGIVIEGSKVVEVIKGTITEKDFPLPSSVVSFTVQENVIVEAIPENAFSGNTNLKTISIITKENLFDIGERAFTGCSSLESVQINGAKLISGLIFQGCSNLKAVALDDVTTINGNFNFNDCIELVSVSLQSLTTVNSDSSMMFLGCAKFTTLQLPSEPPKTFHKNAFSGLRDKLNLILPKEDDYITYDNDNSIDGDSKNDGLWCNLILPTSIINIKVNNRNSIITGLKLSDCISASGFSESEITSLEITRGIIDISTLIDTIKQLLFLENLVISKSIIFRGEWTESLFSGLNLVSIDLPNIKTIPKSCFENCIYLKEVIIDDAITISESAFKGCTSLDAINLKAETFQGDSIFEGCTSLRSISITNLANADPTASKIFLGCPLEFIMLPENPPKTFNKDTFAGMNVLIHGLTNDQLEIYDKNTEIEGDEANDYKWCGINLIQLYVTIKINENEPVQSSSLVNAAGSTPISDVKNIEIQQGMIKKIHLNELKTFTQLKYLTINEEAVLESSILDAGQFQDMTILNKIIIMQKVSIMENCFMGCTSLNSIEFKEVDILCENCFKDCSSLKEAIIPNCIELRGDSIFSGCANLREIDLSSLLKVDNSASNNFKGCSQLTKLKLPSTEPRSFNKNSFVDCPDITLILPNDDDYLAYDDLSNVVDDKKEDFKWCGIELNSKSLPPLLSFKINNNLINSRKLTNIRNPEYSLTPNMLENEVDINQVKSLALVGGEVNSNDLKLFIKGCCETITTFEADDATLVELQSGTFNDCIVLKEIIIHSRIDIKYGALANIPSLTKIAIDLQQNINGNDFAGDTNLQEISLPNIETIPGGLFKDLKKLTTVTLTASSLMLKECFKGCISLVTLDLPNLKKIDGDSHFEGCTSLNTINLPLLAVVSEKSSSIFKGCSSLANIGLGMEPPNIFCDTIFADASKNFKVSIPDEDNGWKNYIYQSSVNEENYYVWKGFQTPLKKDDSFICPEPSECSCPEQSDCPEPSEVVCPEQSSLSCPEVNECSCPEIPVITCPDNKNETVCPSSKKGSNNMPAVIALGVICGILVIAIVVLVVIFASRLKNSQESFNEDSYDLKQI